MPRRPVKSERYDRKRDTNERRSPIGVRFNHNQGLRSGLGSWGSRTCSAQTEPAANNSLRPICLHRLGSGYCALRWVEADLTYWARKSHPRKPVCKVVAQLLPTDAQEMASTPSAHCSAGKPCGEAYPKQGHTRSEGTQLSIQSTSSRELMERAKRAGRVRKATYIAAWAAIALTSAGLPFGTWKAGDDSSWCAVLAYAQQKGLQFGTDLTFTYGPLGFLAVPYFSPAAVWWRLIVAVALSALVTGAVCLLAMRLRALWSCLLLGAFVFVTANAHIGADLLLDIGVLCWGLLCAIESGRRLLLVILGLLVITILGTLVKMTYLFTAGLSLSFVICDLVLRGKQRMAVLTATGIVVGFLITWKALGQGWWHLTAFVATSLRVCQGYAAMGFDAPPRALLSGLIVGALAIGTLSVRAATAFAPTEKHLRVRRWLLFSWLCGLMFLSWKHGFVRADRAHVELFVFMVPMVLLALESVPSEAEKTREWARALSALSVTTALLTLFAPSYLQYCLIRPVFRFSENIQTLSAPGKYRESMNQMFEAERRRAELPALHGRIGDATVDVFCNDQVYAVLNKLNYHPRPIFQGYAAYSRPLMELNEAFYLSRQRPEYVLFKLDPIDKRYPVLEDALVLRALLINYAPVDCEGPFLLLRTNSSVVPKVKLLRTGTVELGQPIELGECAATSIWMEIELKPTLSEKVLQTVYSPPQVRLKVWRTSENQRPMEYVAPASMLSSGFLANPLILTNSDVLRLYKGEPGERVKAYSVTSNGESHFWQEIRFRIYGIDNELAPHITAIR